jgi:hypothetical protein
MQHLKRRLITLGIVLCVAAMTVSAQTGPFSPATIGNDGSGGHYPATLCDRFHSNTCISEEACYYWSGCTGPGPGGNTQDSGGMGNWLIDAHYDSQPVIPYQTNSIGTSQGYIVVIGSVGQTWSFSPNAATGAFGLCTFSPPTAVTFTNTNFDGGRSYYRTLNVCS